MVRMWHDSASAHGQWLPHRLGRVQGSWGSPFSAPTPIPNPNEFRTFYHTSVELMVRTATGSTLTVTASAVAIDWVFALPSRVVPKWDGDFVCDDSPSAMDQYGRWSGLLVSLDDV